MAIEYKFIADKTDEQKIFELKEYLTILENTHQAESDKDSPNSETIDNLETEITAKRTEYEALGGTYD